MYKIISILLFFICLMSGCSKESKIIVCIGDSLTACGGDDGKYSDWLSHFLPHHQFINKGINGDTLKGGRERFEKDVLSYNPQIVIIALGSNDFWQNQRDINELKDDLSYMVQLSKKNNIKIIIASCFGERDLSQENNIEFSKDKFTFAQEIANMEKEICKEYNCYYVPNMQIDIKPNGTVPYWQDSNHPNKKGNKFVAKRILKELKKALKNDSI